MQESEETNLGFCKHLYNTLWEGLASSLCPIVYFDLVARLRRHLKTIFCHAYLYFVENWDI